jgi:hypothetical protein
LNEQFSYNYNSNKRNHCLLKKITLPLDNFLILVAVIVQSLFYNQKRKDLFKNQWFVIGIITIFVIVISNAVIATLVRVDKFGIREIYQTKNGGAAQEWYFNTDNARNDPRTGGEEPYTKFVQKNSDGSWNVRSAEVRYGILTSSGYHPKVITTLSQTQLAKKGYIQSLNDWKNVEMTGYFKVNHFTSSTHNGAAHIELLARGGRNTNEKTLVNGGLPKQCEATTYHSNTYETGRVKFEKDLMHTVGYTKEDPEKEQAIPKLDRKWVGIKAVFYNLSNGRGVKIEQWIDQDASNTWHKVLEFIDNGHWGGGNPNCGGTDHTIITWGGPIAIFRWDNIDNMDIKDFSIREIQDPPVVAYSFNTPAIYILIDVLIVTVILMIYLAISKFKDYSIF